MRITQGVDAQAIGGDFSGSGPAVGLFTRCLAHPWFVVRGVEPPQKVRVTFPTGSSKVQSSTKLPVASVVAVGPASDEFSTSDCNEVKTFVFGAATYWSPESLLTEPAKCPVHC